MSAETNDPWTADTTTFTILPEGELVSMTCDISRIGGDLTDAEEFRSALMYAVDADWVDPELPRDPDS